MHFFCQKICACQKKAVLLQAFSSEMARLSAFALRTEAARISSSPQKSADFRGPRKGVARLSAFALRTEAAWNRKSIGPDGGIGRRAGLKHQWSNPCRFDPGSGYGVARAAAKCDRLAVGGALLSLLFPKTSCRAFGDPGRKWLGEVRSLCERKRLTLAPFPQKSADFRGPRKGVARRSAFALRTEAPYSRSFSPKISRFSGTPEGKKQLTVES